MGVGTPEYSAFISYSRTLEDTAWAKWLHSTLEAYRIPRAIRQRTGNTKRLKRVFRDTEELGAAPSLGKALQEALSESEALIVICSRASQRSAWVQLEVSSFFQTNGRNRIILVLTDGTPADAFPLVFLSPDSGSSGSNLGAGGMPLATDVRPEVGQSLRARRRRARMHVLAALLGLQPDDLIRREQQRQVRVWVGAAATFFAVALTMSVLAYLAVQQREAAQANEREAVYQRAEALIEEGHALNMTNRWLPGFTALGEGRNILMRLGKSTLQADLRILEADHKTLIPYRYLRLPVINGMDASLDGSRLVVASEQVVHVIDLAFDQPVASFDVELPISFVAMAPDGSRVAVASGSELRIFDASTGRSMDKASLERAEIAAAEFVPGTEAIVVAATDGGLHVWDVAASQIVKLSDRDAKTVGFDLSENGNALAMAWADGTTEVCRFSHLRCVDRLRIGAGQPTALVLSRDGKWLITADGKLLRVWNTRTGSLLRESSADAHQLRIIGDILLYADIDGNFSAYDITTGTSLGSFPSPPGLAIPRAVFSRKRAALLTASDDGVLYWQFAFGSAPGSGLTGELPEGAMLNVLSVSTDGRLIATADSKGNVRVFDGHDLSELVTFKAHEGEVTDICFARGGEAVATVGTDGYAVVWELSTSKEAFRHAVPRGKPTAVALDSDATMLAVGTESGNVEVLNLKAEAPITAPLELRKSISSLAFGPTGKRLAIGSAGGAVRVWSKETNSVRKLADLDFQGHPRVRFGPSGAVLAVVAGHTLLWNSTTDRQSRPFGVNSNDVQDAGFLGSDLLYLLRSRGLSIVSVETGREVAYLNHDEDLIVGAGASSTGDVLAVGGPWGIKSFASSNAIERMDLRSRMTALDVTVADQSNGERARLLAAWYLAYGFWTIAIRYVQAPGVDEYSLSPLAMARAWKATGQLGKARLSLASALERGEVTPTYFALATRALAGQAAPNPTSKSAVTTTKPENNLR